MHRQDMMHDTDTREAWASTTLTAALAVRVVGEYRPLQAEQPPNDMNRGVERPKERGKEERRKDRGRTARFGTCPKATAAWPKRRAAVQAELSDGREAPAGG